MAEETPVAENTWEGLLKPEFLKLHPNSAVAAASGGTIGSVSLAGKDYEVRSATYVNLAEVLKITGKGVLSGLNIARDCTPEQLLTIVALALEPKVEIAELMKLGIVNHRKFLEVATAFLWVGVHSTG
jgi:hypothetical protein